MEPDILTDCDSRLSRSKGLVIVGRLHSVPRILGWNTRKSEDVNEQKSRREVEEEEVVTKKMILHKEESLRWVSVHLAAAMSCLGLS